MADTKISALGAAGALAGTEEIPAVQTGTTVKTTPSAIKTYLNTLDHTWAGSTTFSGSVTLKTALTVEGTATFSASVTFKGSVTVEGSATFSGTVTLKTGLIVSATSAAAVGFLGGFQEAGLHKLGSASGASDNALSVSGTWTNYHALHIIASGKGQTTSTNFILNLYTDGGTTAFLTYPLAANSSATASEGLLVADVYGANADAGFKLVTALQHFPSVATQATQTRSATITAGQVNCVKVSVGAAGTTATISAGHLVVYGVLK
jgi:cytoskeletal protein CcmA (bactofilin family)